MVKVTKVIPLSDGLLQISLSDGSTGVFNIKPYCISDFFKELLNEEYFRKVTIFFDGIGWPHGQDIGPDTIAHEMEALVRS